MFPPISKHLLQEVGGTIGNLGLAVKSWSRLDKSGQPDDPFNPVQVTHQRLEDPQAVYRSLARGNVSLFNRYLASQAPFHQEFSAPGGKLPGNKGQVIAYQPRNI
jgi:hypothetical protein